MKAIVVVDKNWNIGREGDLLVHLPGDLKYYKEKTEGHVILIGRKTLESFPGQKPLPNRTNIVLTNNKNFTHNIATVCVGMDSLREELKKYDSDEIWVSGGECIYNLFLDECDEVYVTKIFEEFEADKSFRNLDKDDNFELVKESEIREERGLKYQFTVYKNKGI